jgi:preprotein translocase SecE subunit
MNDKAAAGSSGSFVSRGSAYLSESYEEIKKVQTPTRQEAFRLTLVVLVIIVFISLCLFLMDMSFNWLMGKLTG